MKKYFMRHFFSLIISVFLVGTAFEAQSQVISWTTGYWTEKFGTDREAGGWSDVHPRTVADVNGDGKADIVGFANGGVIVALSNGSSFDTASRWLAAYGRGNNGAGDWHHEYHQRLLSDVNGDGKADIVGFANGGVIVALSTGSSFSQPTLWVAAFGRGNNGAGDWHHRKHLRFLADVNGDGMQDIVGFANAGVVVALSTGTSFSSPTLWVGNFGRDKAAGDWSLSHFRTVADVNGDNKADIVGFANGGVVVSLSTGSSFAAPQLWLKFFGRSKAAGNWRNIRARNLIVDVDGDGLSDIMGFSKDGAYYARSTGRGFEAPQQFSYRCSGDERQRNHCPHHESVVVAYVYDYNGDGMGDLAIASYDDAWVQDLTEINDPAIKVFQTVGADTPLPRPYRHMQLADVTGDNKPDLVWFHTGGVLVHPTR